LLGHAFKRNAKNNKLKKSKLAKQQTISVPYNFPQSIIDQCALSYVALSSLNLVAGSSFGPAVQMLSERVPVGLGGRDVGNLLVRLLEFTLDPFSSLELGFGYHRLSCVSKT
jgi:hypothetical protein